MINLHSSSAAAAASPDTSPSSLPFSAAGAGAGAASSAHHHLLPPFHHHHQLPLLHPPHHHHHPLPFPIPPHPSDSEMMPPNIHPPILGRTPIMGAMDFGNSSSSCNGYNGGSRSAERQNEVGGHLAAAARSSTPACAAVMEHNNHVSRGYGYNSSEGRSAEMEVGGGELNMQQGYGAAAAAAGSESQSHSQNQSQNNVMDDAGSGRAAANDGNRSTSYGSGGGSGGSSRYESQKRRDWNTFGQYLKNQHPPLTLAVCSGAHVLDFLRYLDQFGKTKVHTASCPYFGRPQPPAPCACPLRQAWGSLDALIGRLRAAFEEHGGRPEANPFGARAVRLYLREVKETQAKARGIAYEKKKRRAAAAAAASQRSSVAGAGGGASVAPPAQPPAAAGSAHMQAAAQPRFLEH